MYERWGVDIELNITYYPVPRNKKAPASQNTYRGPKEGCNSLYQKRGQMSSTKLLSLDTVITASGRYPDRAKSPELTDEVKSNINDLITRVNTLLIELGVKQVTVSSGFRPSAVNAGVKGAAKKSNHLIGKALDLYDPKGELDKLFMSNLKTLEKHGLYLEHPDATVGWAHLQSVTPRSGNRVFKP